ncbi:Hypothetical predicted protein [Pelobates cultripes]|uniref:Retrotransposon gag domain-containing protein n=1 Tax=Pelobates cultripes TaxID=61616 RepID=A0AAD1STM5_PELCU|nr:Hypothetical predicted protein [Pelobates cultripes]
MPLFATPHGKAPAETLADSCLLDSSRQIRNIRNRRTEPIWSPQASVYNQSINPCKNCRLKSLPLYPELHKHFLMLIWYPCQRTNLSLQNLRYHCLNISLEIDTSIILLLWLVIYYLIYYCDAVKIRTVITLLSGPPQEWANDLLCIDDPSIQTWTAFDEAMTAMYDDPNRQDTAQTAIRALCQGRRPVKEYIT